MAQDKTKEVVRVIDAPIADIWAIIAAFGSEKLWFPNVIKSSLEGFGIGSVRTLTFNNGHVVHERLEIADPETHTITYLILDGVPNTTNPRGTLQLTAISEDKTQFSWSGASEWTEPSFQPVLAGMLEEMFNGCMDAIESIFK
ncbi:bet V I allergen [Colletotrichum scovillei]|uniref:Bet V I allergen n=1 Tax=Colletotrichum scovillei TaxID=1209932 RepID=A0A9P7QU96_9PEZI|nr:bet V I allergen [Colletotrichum scovillei]KAF4775143.1 bet V I allergen [Colletotrichum scovillei]KAG7039058.1 bet V I allergen [Colletotrichum scovillei]KAG7041238.1 bet V I allergen [Colletotrichum scovillei]KAG7061270.1 bet V I allergen [Colletotrichum scovillei]